MFSLLVCLSITFLLDICKAERYLPCSAEDNCPSYAQCVNAGSKGHICLCRANRRFSNMTWPEGCNGTFVPIGVSIREKDGISPDNFYSMIPDSMFTSSAHGPGLEAKSARLYESSAWCAPDKNTNHFLQIDLGISSNISMIATQGDGTSPILQYAEQFEMEYSLDGSNWINVTEDGANIGLRQIFTANNGASNDEVIYNTFNNVLHGRFFKIIIVKHKLKTCFRFELFGEREFDECSQRDWNKCDKEAAHCINLFAAYKCNCFRGYEDLLFGSVCQETDECLYGTHNCSRYATCTNIPGSFKCQCKDGYQGDGYYCEDIDECTSSPCVSDAFCTNLNPSYACTCKAGFAGDGNTCADVDECSNGMNDCHRTTATCTNTRGSFICTCNSGYSGNGRQCIDIDECKLGTHNCHQFAKCTNTIGGFSCDCITPGFRGNGLYCSDIDECSLGVNEHHCKSTERCFNLVGSHKCQCPKEIPVQPQYIDTETMLFGELADELGHISEQESDDPLDDYAQKIRKIYQLAKEVYDYHSKETYDSFYTVNVAGNKIAFEMYDFRCTDVKTLAFPNNCHSSYANAKYWSTITDKIDIQFVAENVVPFEQWATARPSTAPTTAPATTQPNPNSTNVITTSSSLINITAAPTPQSWRGKPCPLRKFNGSRGYIHSPLFPNNYPLDTVCQYLIEVSELKNVYINFTFFELEKDRKCVYDNVKIYDGKTEDDRLIAQYCGYDGLPLPVRSSGRYMLVVFRSDSRLAMKGFNATWAALEARVSVSCMVFNPISYTSDSRLHTKYLARMFETDRSMFVPIARMMACLQYPQCNVSLPRPIEFTFEHTITDRTEKQCIHWNLNAYGTKWSKHGCTVGLTNKTHTVCKCWPYGIVTVIGRDRPYYPPEKAKIAFKLGTNCLMSLILVVLTLIGTLLYLTFKDNWIPYFMTILRDKDYDSGRIIQMHIVLNVLFTEIFFSSITFHMTASLGSCFFMAFIFYYLLLTVFVWLFIYTLFLQSRVTPVFNSSKYNSYKIYLAIGYGIPFLITLTVTGLNFKMKTNERMCWILFNGTTVWGYSSSVCTLALGSIMLLFVTIYNANEMDDGILLQEKCLKNLFTTVFCLFAAVFGARAVETGQYSAQYMFSLFNVLLCYSILLIYCILTREQPMVQTNKVAPSNEGAEMSALGMLAEIAMAKYQEEKKNTDLESMFRADTSPTPRKKRGFKDLDMNEDDRDFGSRAESGIASQGEDSESDDDREDGRIHFRFDEYHEMQQFEQQTLEKN